jgi:hypothetical protein
MWINYKFTMLCITKSHQPFLRSVRAHAEFYFIGWSTCLENYASGTNKAKFLHFFFLRLKKKTVITNNRIECVPLTNISTLSPRKSTIVGCVTCVVCAFRIHIYCCAVRDPFDHYKFHTNSNLKVIERITYYAERCCIAVDQHPHPLIGV